MGGFFLAIKVDNGVLFETLKALMPCAGPGYVDSAECCGST